MLKSIFSAAAILLLASLAQAAVYTVTKAADTNDGVCDSDCSLREAAASAIANTTEKSIIVFSTVLDGVPIVLTAGEIDVTGLHVRGLGADKITISGNNSSRIFFSSTSTYLSGMTLTGGNGVGQTITGVAGGGAVRLEGDCAVDGVYFVGNATTSGEGRAAYFGIGGKIYNSTFSANPGTPKAVVYIYANNTSLQPIYNSTLVDDGIVLAVNLSTATFRNSTVMGQISVGTHSQISAANSVINTINSVPSLSLFQSLGHNIITNPAPNGNTVNYDLTTDRLRVEPGFSGGLSNSGGKVPTLALATTSPAINTGKNSLAPSIFDQRAYQRIVSGTVDIGAFELNSAPSPTVSYAGRLVNDRGWAVGIATITVVDQYGNVQEKRPTSLGYFRFSNLSPGKFYVLVRSKQYQTSVTSPQVDANIANANLVLND